MAQLSHNYRPHTFFILDLHRNLHDGVFEMFKWLVFKLSDFVSPLNKLALQISLSSNPIAFLLVTKYSKTADICQVFFPFRLTEAFCRQCFVFVGKNTLISRTVCRIAKKSLISSLREYSYIQFGCYLTLQKSDCIILVSW